VGKPRYTITLENTSAAADLDAVKAGLSVFNRQVIQFDASDEYRPVHLLVRANDGTVMGGLLGGTWWGWLYINILWVHEDLRGQDFGSDLMRVAEHEALQRGCHSAYVDTHSFQALPFYQKLGYAIFGELDDFPTGHKRYFLQKRLLAE
jgi:GNAT superfamily N-acetyltransferase